MKEPNNFELAIRASGMTKTQAQSCIGFKAYTSLQDRLDDPGNFRLRELVSLSEAMPEKAVKMLKQATLDFF